MKADEFLEVSAMPTESSIAKIYAAVKEISGTGQAKDYVSDLLYTIISRLEEEGVKVTPQKISKALEEEAAFTHKCLRKKRKAA